MFVLIHGQQEDQEKLGINFNRSFLMMGQKKRIIKYF